MLRDTALKELRAIQDFAKHPYLDQTMIVLCSSAISLQTSNNAKTSAGRALQANDRTNLDRMVRTGLEQSPNDRPGDRDHVPEQPIFRFVIKPR